MKEYLIVDGYNMIGAWPNLKEIKEDSLEYAREKLIEVLATHKSLTGRYIIVVFDAYQVKGNTGNKKTVLGIDVVFTREGVTADMMIERLSAQIPKYRKVYVATSDRLQQETVWNRGALRISAMELYREVNEIIKENKPRYEKKIYQSNRLEDQLNPEIRKKMEEMQRQKD